MKSILIVVIVLLMAAGCFAQLIQNPFDSWDKWSPSDTVFALPEVDYSPPDTFETILASQDENIITLTFDETEVDSADRWRIGISIYMRDLVGAQPQDQGNKIEPPTPEFITFDELTSNPDTSYAIQFAWYYQSIGDTVDTADFTITVYDSSGNPAVQTVTLPLECYYETYCPVDTVYLGEENSDSIYYVFKPNHWTSRNNFPNGYFSTTMLFFHQNGYMTKWSYTKSNMLADSTYGRLISQINFGDTVYIGVWSSGYWVNRSLGCEFLSDTTWIDTLYVPEAEASQGQAFTMEFPLNF